MFLASAATAPDVGLSLPLGQTSVRLLPSQRPSPSHPPRLSREAINHHGTLALGGTDKRAVQAAAWPIAPVSAVPTPHCMGMSAAAQSSCGSLKCPGVAHLPHKAGGRQMDSGHPPAHSLERRGAGCTQALTQTPSDSTHTSSTPQQPSHTTHLQQHQVLSSWFQCRPSPTSPPPGACAPPGGPLRGQRCFRRGAWAGTPSSRCATRSQGPLQQLAPAAALTRRLLGAAQPPSPTPPLRHLQRQPFRPPQGPMRRPRLRHRSRRAMASGPTCPRWPAERWLSAWRWPWAWPW